MKNCKICNKPLHEGKIYCSNKCYGIDRIGKPSGMFGKKHSKKTIALIKKNAKYGNDNPAKRKEVREKISKKLTGRKLSKQHIENIKKGGGGFSKGCVPWNKGIKWVELSLKRMRENNPAWRGGTSFVGYGKKFTRSYKKDIRKRDGNQCFLCLKCQKDEGRALAVHHIDYNKNNNSLDNLITLCSSCHSKTNINRKKWIKIFNER